MLILHQVVWGYDNEQKMLFCNETFAEDFLHARSYLNTRETKTCQGWPLRSSIRRSNIQTNNTTIIHKCLYERYRGPNFIMCVLSLECTEIREVIDLGDVCTRCNRSLHGTTWNGVWDWLQGTFLGGEVTYTKELKHGLMKSGCVLWQRKCGWDEYTGSVRQQRLLMPC